MSAPETRDPRFVNTKDACWVRRAVTSDGRGLYAVEGSCRCPEFLLVSLAELAAVGIVGSADVVPAPSVSFAERAAAESDPARRVAWRMLVEPEPEFHAWLHHENRVSHDLPETGGADPEERLLDGDDLKRAVRGHLFGGGAS
ncbi:hypothetical protein [Streptomyces caniscabiei]|uniref:hypothetical protein n=1 Tax=Streptomyces caniscabiei TaxID=2746961 RepID=UPI001872707A|nr:hypothetical protein [Streptomyces caniscabiei]MBE4796192.1 hypothetical protein [Streptomyces caniscabiei]MDX2944500.1 hypothetical protein [Streptomyces caniscabiei]